MNGAGTGGSIGIEGNGGPSAMEEDHP